MLADLLTPTDFQVALTSRPLLLDVTMTVAASIILAAVAGGIIFVLLDSWQRRATTPTDGRPGAGLPARAAAAAADVGHRPQQAGGPAGQPLVRLGRPPLSR